MALSLDPRRVESLGPAERILQALLTHTDHIYHGRPGVVVPMATAPIGARWFPATHEDGVVYKLLKSGRKSERRALGQLQADGRVVNGRNTVGRYRRSGLFNEAAAWLYGQVAEVWELDNEFAARWASWAFAQEHRDLKVVLAAFMLVQSRSGEPVVEDGEVIFHDDDYRSVGEAMCLLRRRDGRDLNPRLLLRVGDLLALPEVAAINRRLGFGRSARRPPMGRYNKAVTRWLAHRERNPKMLQGLVKAGFRTTVMKLARRAGYRPLSPRFFEILRWKQSQASDGRRAIALGVDVATAETWSGLGEAEICQRIVETRPNWNRLVGMLPAEVGLTRAIVAAAMQVGAISDRELIILTPTLEALGLLEIPEIGERWLAATAAAEDQRAARIAQRVRGRETARELESAADRALQRAVADETRGLRVYVAVDVSGSMSNAIERAKGYLTRFLQGFPLDKLMVCVFNTGAREVRIRRPSAGAVKHAFKGFKAGGGTYHTAAIVAFSHRPPGRDEDALVLFVGDQQERGHFADAVQRSGLRPAAFGFLDVGTGRGRHRAVEDTAIALNIPCFRIDEDMFDDVYAIPRTLRTLIAATPVGQRAPTRGPRNLVETILETELLNRPVWAA